MLREDRESQMDSFRNLVESSHYFQNAPVDKSTDECAIEEEADTFGFSLVSAAGSSRTGQSSSHGNILNAFRSDGNWNNPASVALMSRAFGITDEYACLLLPPQKCLDERNYMLIKAEQNSMFAKRRFADGVMYRDKGSVADSVKSFGEAIYFDSTYTDAYMERAGLYVRLGKHMDALNDYKAVLAQQPEHVLAMQQYMSLCGQLRIPTLQYGGSRVSTSSSASLHAYDFGGDEYPSKDTSQHSNTSSVAKPESTTSSNVGLISKLQHALRKDPTKLLDPSSSDSSTSSSDSESSTGSDEKSRKRKRKDHKDRRSKESRSAKKRKSKDKKAKHKKSSKHKKRKRDDDY